MVAFALRVHVHALCSDADLASAGWFSVQVACVFTGLVLGAGEADVQSRSLWPGDWDVGSLWLSLPRNIFKKNRKRNTERPLRMSFHIA